MAFPDRETSCSMHRVQGAGPRAAFDRKTLLAALLSFCLVVASALGCSCSRAETSKNVLVIGTTMSITDIGINDYYMGILRSAFTHNGLVSLDADGRYVGDLAQSYETKDGRTWAFKLRDGVRWHDGQPFTAADVKFSIEYLLEKVPVYKSHWAMIDRVEAPDPRTVIITLKKPNARFLVNLLVSGPFPSTSSRRWSTRRLMLTRRPWPERGRTSSISSIRPPGS